MADYKNVEILDIGSKKSVGKNKLFLIISGSALLLALVVCTVLLLTGASLEDTMERVVEYGTVMKGVTVGGIDISGMTPDEARAATASLPEQMLGQINFDVDINGEIKQFTAQQFALYTDYDDAIEKAIAYGRTGTFDERLDAANAASASGIDFPVEVYVDEAGLKTSLEALKSELDTPAINAKAEFAPWGYTETQNDDGTMTYTPYTPQLEEIKEICDTYAHGKEYEKFPEGLVRIPDADMPNALRYEYWNDRKKGDDKYEEKSIQRDANISRFIYTQEVDGLIVYTDSIYDEVILQVNSDTYETIVAKVDFTPAEITLEDVKNETQLIASWTSSFGGGSHYNYARNYNVAMMSSRLHGSEIKPGGEWSVNDTAGLRNASTAKTYGWQKAAGIENGGYSPQYGGGVCQLGSTVFNSAIRSGLTIAKQWHHSIPSDYVPIGLDATLDSGGKDLKLKNETEKEFYLVSYIDPIERCVTVEFYGVPLTDSTGRQIIKKYTSKQTGRYGEPVSGVVPVPEGYVCPDNTIISADPAIGVTAYEYAKNRQGTYAKSYVTTYALDGTQIGETQDFDSWKYPMINGTTYVLAAPAPPVPDPVPAA